MKRKALALVLVCLMVFGLGACKNQERSRQDVDLKRVGRQDLGANMPKILFAHNNQITFWGTFGLFVINIEDGSIHRSLNLENIEMNNMTGEEITRFQFSEDYNRIFFFNEGRGGENVDPVYYYYNVEEDVVRQIPVGTAVEILPQQPAFALDIAGGEPGKGYASNAVFIDENHSAYLYADDWRVKNLNLVVFDIEAEELRSIPIFK